MIKLNDDNFEQETSEGVVLVYIGAEWCAPCRMIKPIIEELVNEVTDVKIVKVDADESAMVTSKFGIRSIPTFIMLKDGVTLQKKLGSVDKNSLIELMNIAK